MTTNPDQESNLPEIPDSSNSSVAPNSLENEKVWRAEAREFMIAYYKLEGWEASSWATTNYEFGYLTARKKAQEEIDKVKWQHALTIKANDNQILMIEKRDALLDQCLPWIIKLGLIEGDKEKLTGGVNSYGSTYRQWLKDFGALR